MAAAGIKLVEAPAAGTLDIQAQLMARAELTDIGIGDELLSDMGTAL